MPSQVRQPLRPYTGVGGAVSHGALALPATRKRAAQRTLPRAADAPAARGRSGRMVWVALLAILAGWMFAAANPGNLAAMTARLSSLALGVAPPTFEIARVEARRTVLDGQTILYVDGALANKSASALKSPGLVITIIGEDDQPLYTWRSKVAQSRIEASREAPFEARLLSPPETFKSIKVSLAKEN